MVPLCVNIKMTSLRRWVISQILVYLNCQIYHDVSIRILGHKMDRTSALQRSRALERASRVVKKEYVSRLQNFTEFDRIQQHSFDF